MKINIDNNCSIHYIEYGEGKPILFLHGFPEDYRVMVGCVEPIINKTANFRRIYIDLPGMGQSKAPGAIKSADDMVEILVSFIKVVIGNQRFLLVGQSYGCYLALGLLSIMHGSIDGVFFLCPCLIANRGERNLPTSELLEQDSSLIYSNRDNPIFSDFLYYAVIANEYTWDRFQTDIYPGLMIANKEFTDYYETLAYSFIDEKTTTSSMYFVKPVGIITARQDNCVGFRDMEALLDNFPRSTFAIIDGAGHNMQIERPSIFNCLFLDWLERIKTEKKSSNSISNNYDSSIIRGSI